MRKDQLDGPIPGENYTRDTRNFPWHRPPEYTDLNEAIEFTFSHLTKKKNAFDVLTLIEMGMTVTEYTTALVMSGVGDGKWTPDFAVLLAGPTAHIVQMLCDGYGIDYEMGYEDDPSSIITRPLLEGLTEINGDRIPEAIEEIDLDEIQATAATQEEAPPARGGFMSRPSLSSESEMETI